MRCSADDIFTEAWRPTADGWYLPDHYEHWIELVEKLFAGLEIQKINVEPDEFQAWCVLRGMTPSLTACRKYILNL